MIRGVGHTPGKGAERLALCREPTSGWSSVASLPCPGWPTNSIRSFCWERALAGDWIKIEHVMPDKPEVGLLADALGLSHDEVVGKLLRFWIWADQQSRDGRDIPATTSLIDRIVLCETFAENLEKVGWLRRTKKGFTVPNFARHNGKSAKNRTLTTERKREERSRKRHDGNVTKPGPEKRREEKSTTLTYASEREYEATSDVPEVTGSLSPVLRPLQEAGVFLPIPNDRPFEVRAQIRQDALAFIEQHGPEKAEALIRSVLPEKPKTLKQALFFVERKKEREAPMTADPDKVQALIDQDRRKKEERRRQRGAQ